MEVTQKNGNKYIRHYSFNGIYGLLKKKYGTIGGENPAIIAIDDKVYHVRLDTSSGAKPILVLDGECNG